ncbi:hypothetical protein JIN84_00290 [Luteolibacter yonseiensis]|uniref:Uncharacterized protein n=1 Tax=Luteolibacter yonseiensis TaxID=1144680 RepID=A0A934R2C6_9BACT|nr:hypothetical protein [Luteolibacter yonseiensis]MBK1814045.1 hypothetical protein [Luteolibacter yonseiensis]
MIPETDSFLNCPSHVDASCLDYMWIGPSEKFLVCAVTQRADPLSMVFLAVHFRASGPSAVEVRLAGYDKWVTHELRQEGETLWWTINGQDVPWTFISPDAVPEMARKRFARGREKLLKDGVSKIS